MPHPGNFRLPGWSLQRGHMTRVTDHPVIAWSVPGVARPETPTERHPGPDWRPGWPAS